MTVLVVIDPRAASVPANFGAGLRKAGLFSDVGKCAVAVVARERVLAVVSDEEIVIAVVVVIADAAGLSPTGAVLEAGAFRDIGEGAVAIVLEETAVRLLACGETFQTPSVDQEHVEPAVVIVIVKGKTAAGGLEKIFVPAFAAIGGFHSQSRLLNDIDEADAERRAFNGRLGAFFGRSRGRVVAALDRAGQLLSGQRGEIGEP